MLWITRAGLGLVAPKKAHRPMAAPRGFIIHHKGGTHPTSAADARRRWLGSQRYHMAPPRWVEELDAKGRLRKVNRGGKGWDDIAYSWGFGDWGEIYEGRGWNVQGAHTKGYNATHHAFCYVGHGVKHEPTELAFEALCTLTAEHDELFGPGEAFAHSHVSATLCPGPHLQGWIDLHHSDRNPH